MSMEQTATSTIQEMPGSMATSEGRNGASPAESSLLTRPGEEGETATGGDFDQAGNTVPEAPEGYVFSFPEGTAVDKNLAGEFQKTAHSLGLKQSQAQSLAALYAGHVAEREKAQMQSLVDTRQGWETEIKSKPGFKQDYGHARSAIVSFGHFGHTDADGKPALHPELKEIFDDTIIGSHPKVFQMFAEIGKALAEPTVRGSGTGSGRGLNFYPSMSKR